MTVKTISNAVIDEARDLIRGGGCVAIPTETVYGLAADAQNGMAVTKIFETKGRPSFNPLISHFHDLAHVQDYVDLCPQSMLLAQKFWPGPLTLIVPRRSSCKIHDLTTAGLDTIAIRVPSHPAARQIIKACDCPLAAPSANKSGEVSPTTAFHVQESLGDKVRLIIADGSSTIGLESTVIDMTGDQAVILRPGAITAEDCHDILPYEIETDNGHHGQPKSPGQLLKHYAPKTPIRLKAYDIKENEALLAFGSTKFMPIQNIPDHYILNLSESGDLHEAATNLFSYLRRLDACGANSMAVMDIPDISIGIAINDRLKRAAEFL